jgi:hypothetical protein
MMSFKAIAAGVYCYHPPMASQIQREITQAFPLIAKGLSDSTLDDVSDSRWMQELGSHVVALFAGGHIKEVGDAFELAEQLITDGSAKDRHAAIVGFLETVQNIASHREHGAAVFEQFLRPKSRIAWAELNQVWKGKGSLAEVVAAETGAKMRPRWWQFWRKHKTRSPKEMLNQVENPELRKIIEQMTRE